MSINWKCLLPIIINLAVISPVLAATKYNSGTASTRYMVIENNVDNELFITPAALDPRFTGANVWTRYSTNQVSLGYLGNSAWAAYNTYFDIWFTDSPITHPFEGIRCTSNGNACPASGYIPAEISDDNGFYHTKSGNNLYNGGYGFGSLSAAAFEHFRSKPVGGSDALELNFCRTTTNYDYSDGTRCKDLPTGAYWYYYNVTYNKSGHLILNSTNAVAEIWIASDGTPSIAPGSSLCEVATVPYGGDGLVCKTISYSLQESQTLTPYLYFNMLVDKTILGFTPAAYEVMYSGDASNWSNYATQNYYYTILKPANQYVYVFLSNKFFKKVLNSGKDLTNKTELFTFNFYNATTPESGYYQFTPSNLIEIVPKEYGISIISADGSAHPKNSGKIGDEKPIEFEYRIRTSASRQADSVTVQVTGDSTTIGKTPYCVFSSTDGKLQVPIPAYLSFSSSAGATVTHRNSCAEDAIDITDALWTQTAWEANVDNGYFFTTNVKLQFPMNDSRSHFSLTGEDWMGTVSASGEVKATATWLGVE